ncbi:MAG: DGQHR domain-containing protein [Thermoplasmata archaeon]
MPSVLALRVAQKDGIFYMVSYRAPDILHRVRFLSRDYGGAEEPARPGEEEIAAFIRGVEKSDAAFQRALIRRKVRDILNFYENAQSQPMIPGPVLLYTDERLDFQPLGGYTALGNLSEPSRPFIIIDGQHRLAGLSLFASKHPELAESVEVPAIIFDGRQEDFAAEMFVIINSTHTRINRSHLVDLMEKVTYGATPEKKWAAWIVRELYENQGSPLRYKINRLGGRSRQDKWILQSELYNEIYRLVDPRRAGEAEAEERRGRRGRPPGTGAAEGARSIHRFIASEYGWERRGRAPELFIEYFRAVRATFGEIWGSEKYMLNTSVCIKALVRTLGNLLAMEDVRREWRKLRSASVFTSRIQGWAALAADLRREGFYERFAAKGQVERVRVIHRELVRRLGGGS